MFPSHLILSVSDIKSYERNARTHSPAQIQQISDSIRQFGFCNPVLVDEEYSLIAGHVRLAAAQLLRYSELPAIVVTGLSPAQKQALRLADNKLALNAGWDDDLLRSELGDLRDSGFDLALTGFGDEELAALFADRTAELTDPDDVPETPAEPVTQPGDVWLLGRHRLVCGDATSEVDVSLCLGAVKPHLMVTDPPYGVDFDPTWRRGSEHRTYMGDKPDKEFLWAGAWALFPGDVIYIWHAAERTAQMWECLNQFGFEYRAQIIWNKDRFIIGRGHYCYNHEPCFYGVRKSATGHWQGARDQPTVWTIQHKSSDTNHGAQKPVECMKRPIENNSSPGQAVYEPFSGSGTTIIAAEMTGRACHALEISENYCDVAALRWMAFTGQQAFLAADGRSFEDVKSSRFGAPV